MGEIRVSVVLENAADKALCDEGRLGRKKVRRAEVVAIVDTGAVMTLIPKELASKLGLRAFDTVTVSLADDRRIELEKAGPLALTIGDRPMVTDCLVGPLGCETLIGQIVMEELDLIPDPRRRTIGPRPESPFRPTLKLKSACATY